MTSSSILEFQHRSNRFRQAQIGKGLAQRLTPVTTDPVPDEFLRLLEAADQIKAGRKPI